MQKNSKQIWGVTRLILLLLLAIGISSSIGIAITTLVYNGAPTVEFYMAHPFPGVLAATAAEVCLSILVYKKIGKRVLNRNAEEVPAVRRLRGLLLGVAIGGGAVTLSALVLAVLRVYRPLGAGSVKGVAVGLALGLGAGVAEELLFRGVILRLFYEKWGAARAFLLTSLIFGALHFSNNMSVAEALGVFVAAGLLLNGVWFLTKRIEICIGAHFAWNFFLGGVFGMPVSGVPMTDGGFIRCQLSGADIMTGGISGPEASLPFVITMALVGAAVLAGAWKRNHSD